MRLRGIRIDAYGLLRDWQVEGLDAHDLIVVLGPNESGKSTIREFVATGFFGFSPATRDAHPYAPDDGVFGGALMLTGADGTAVAVERHLRSTPRGRIWMPDRHEDIGNRPLPEVASIGRALYTALHQLTPEDVAVVSETAWQAVEDRMLSGSAVAFLRSVAIVRQELDDEALTLWRPDRRGQPRARALETQIAALRRLEREGTADRERIGQIDAELAAIAGAEASARAALEQAAERLRRHARLAPAVAAHREAADMRRRADALLTADDLPAEPAAELDRLDTAAADAGDDAARAGARLGVLQARAIVTPDVAMLAEGAPGLREAAALAAMLPHRLLDLAAAERSAAALADEAGLRATTILGRPLRPGDRDAIEDVDGAALHAALMRLEAASRSRMTRALRPLALVAGALAVALAVIAAAADSPLVPGLAAAAMAALAVAAAAAGRGSPPAGAWDALRAALGDLAVCEARLAAPDRSLAIDIERLAAAIAAADESRVAAEQLASELARTRARLEAAAGTTTAAGIVQRLAAAEAAAEHVRDAERAATEIVAAEAEATRLAMRARALGDERARLRERLAEVGGGTPDEGLRRVAEARGLRAAAAARERAADARGDLELLLREARSAPDAILDDDALRALEEARAGLTRELEGIHGQRGGLAAERRALLGRPGVAEAAGEAGALQDQLAEVLVRRDRLALAASVLREAERRYREANGPRFVQAASRYLAAITGGRYERILLSDAVERQHLELVRKGVRQPVPAAHPLSRGTLEQVNLAMRLALVDEVDPQRLLPLFLDESLVHWDEDRLGQAGALLAAAGGRQVVVTTCHAAIGSRLAMEGALVIRLEIDGDGAAMSPASSSTAIP